jgi:two-component sensor histidine kinase
VEEKNRVFLKGPPVALDPKTAVALGIVFHELATNAIKHGALSNQNGNVEVRWGMNGDGAVALQWNESKGPVVRPPAGAGFGSRLIRLEMTHELHGEVELIYAADGLKVVLGFPLMCALDTAQLKQGIAQ